MTKSTYHLLIVLHIVLMIFSGFLGFGILVSAGGTIGHPDWLLHPLFTPAAILALSFIMAVEYNGKQRKGIVNFFAFAPMFLFVANLIILTNF